MNKLPPKNDIALCIGDKLPCCNGCDRNPEVRESGDRQNSQSVENCPLWKTEYYGEHQWKRK